MSDHDDDPRYAIERAMRKADFFYAGVQVEQGIVRPGGIVSGCVPHEPDGFEWTRWLGAALTLDGRHG